MASCLVSGLPVGGANNELTPGAESRFFGLGAFAGPFASGYYRGGGGGFPPPYYQGYTGYGGYNGYNGGFGGGFGGGYRTSFNPFYGGGRFGYYG